MMINGMSWEEYANKIEVGVFRLSRMLQTFGGESDIDSERAIINFDFEGMIDGSITIFSNNPDSCIYVKYPNTPENKSFLPNLFSPFATSS